MADPEEGGKRIRTGGEGEECGCVRQRASPVLSEDGESSKTKRVTRRVSWLVANPTAGKKLAEDKKG